MLKRRFLLGSVLLFFYYVKTTGDESGAVVAHLPPTNVTQVQIPMLMPHVG